MSHASIRPTHWILGAALACAASLTFANGAAAQLPAVNSPFEDSVCNSPSDVTDKLADPNGYYAEAPKCESLCRRAGKDCAQYVKLAGSCQKAEIGDDAAYSKQECEVEFEHGTATTSCKTEIEHQAGEDRLGASTERKGALDACDAWEKQCEATCPHH